MSPRLKPLLHHFYHYGMVALGGAIIIVCVVALGLKLWVMPNISHFQPQVVAVASHALGRPVTLGAMEAGWEGINPRLTLRDLRVVSDHTTLLSLPVVEARFSWLSLLLLEPHLTSLTLERPQFVIRRDHAGVIYLAGIAVNVPAAPNPLPDWLLRQPRILVRGAGVSWQDEMLAAPILRLDQIRLYVRNGFGRHRFAGIALPSDAAGRLELRGDLRGRSLRASETWAGQIYARVDAARFDTWGHWVPWAQKAVRRGTGSLRFWIDVVHGQAQTLTGDTRLSDVAINVSTGEALPDLAFQSLTGRIGWTHDDQGQTGTHTFSVERLRFAVAGETPSEPAAVRVSLTPDGHGGFKKIAVNASNLRLEALTALTGALPLPRRGHDLIAALNPRGLVASAAAQWSGLHDYKLNLHVRDAGLNAYGNLPGFSGLTARIEANQASGEAELSGHDTVLSLDRVFRQALPFRQIDVHTNWKINHDLAHLAIESASFQNDDLAGTASGGIDLPMVAGASSPRLDLEARLSHGDAAAVYRYLPQAVGHAAYDWLKRALIAGHTDAATLVLKGDLARFPFDQGGGEFKVAVKLTDVGIDYAREWPRIDHVNGTLVFHGKGMSIDTEGGDILATHLGAVHARIPDLFSGGHEVLWIDGQVDGLTQSFLDFIEQSPVRAHTAGFTEKMRADGRGELALRLRLPLSQIKDTTLNGIFSMDDNRVELGGELPALERIKGRIGFSDSAVQARNIQTQVLGLPTTLSFDSRGGSVHAHLDGSATASALAPHLPVLLAHRLSGACRWQAEVNMGRHEIQITSDLAGLALDLPSPFRKSAAQVVPLTITRSPDALEDNVIQASYGNLLSLRAEIPVDGPAWISLRLAQGEAPAPREAGIHLSGALRTLDLDAWRALDFGAAQENATSLREVNLTLNELKVAGRLLHDTHVGVKPEAGGWKISLAGRELDGEVLTQDENGRVLAHFKRLSIPESATLAGEAGDLGQSLPDIDLNAKNFRWRDLYLGELQLRGAPEKYGYRLNHLSLSLPEGHVEGKGMVSRQPRRPTRLSLNLEALDLGKLLARLGYPGSVKGGEGKGSGTLYWNGGPEDFAIAKLNGDFAITVKKGQFLRVEPGAAKLLGILSLQALPRRISLDFRDIFSDGFAFDEISGDIHLERGSAYTRNLKLHGPAARVGMSGVVDLDQQTQNLRVSIQPRLEDTVLVAGAILGGPVVGLGALLANQILKNPIDQVASFDYGVTGTWSDPVITKLKRPVPTR